MSKEGIKMKKKVKVNWKKIRYYAKKCISYYGAISLGMFISAGLAYGWFGEIILGIGLSIVLMTLSVSKIIE